MESNNTHLNELLNKTIFNEILPRYTETDGYVTACFYNEIKHLIDNFEVRDTDVWITSFPRSGTTWMQETVWLIVNNLDYEDAKRSVLLRIPYIEMQSLCDWDLLDKKFNRKTPNFITKSIEFANNQTTKNHRCIKTHLPYDLLPNQIKEGNKKAKIIHVIREPKDVFVSYYYHFCSMHHFKGTFDEFKTLFLHDKVIPSPYWKLVNSYWMRRESGNILIIRYEDMKNDLQSVIQRLAHFLNKTIPEDRMNQLLSHLTFESMRNNRSINYEDVNTEKGADPNSRFFRKGKIDDHKDLLSQEVIVELDNWIRKNDTLGVTI